MSRRRNQSSGSGGWPAVLGVLFLIGLIIKFFWWIIGALALAAAFFAVRAIIRHNQSAAAARDRAHAAIVARADQQHTWVLSGDDRGIYGPESAKLMKYINGAPDEMAQKEAS